MDKVLRLARRGWAEGESRYYASPGAGQACTALVMMFLHGLAMMEG